MITLRYRTLAVLLAGSAITIAAGLVSQDWRADAAPGGGHASTAGEAVAASKQRVDPPASWLAGGNSFVEALPVDAGAPSEFVPIPAYRAYDSRLGGDSRWVVGDDYVVPVLSDTDLVDRVPGEATALAFNITVTNAQGAGYVQIYGPGVAAFSTSTVNWSPPTVVIANSGSSEIGTYENSPGWMGVAMGGTPGSSAHVIIDITGYYQAVHTHTS